MALKNTYHLGGPTLKPTHRQRLGRSGFDSLPGSLAETTYRLHRFCSLGAWHGSCTCWENKKQKTFFCHLQRFAMIWVFLKMMCSRFKQHPTCFRKHPLGQKTCEWLPCPLQEPKVDRKAIYRSPGLVFLYPLND